jgi:hypothetical protein
MPGPVFPHGFVSDEWQKLPMLWGYSGSLIKRYGNTDIALASPYVASDPVPSGEVWVITNVTTIYVGTAPTRIFAQLISGADTPNLWEDSPIVAGTIYNHNCNLILGEADYLQLAVNGATAHDAVYLDMVGYIMDVDK